MCDASGYHVVLLNLRLPPPHPPPCPVSARHRFLGLLSISLVRHTPATPVGEHDFVCRAVKASGDGAIRPANTETARVALARWRYTVLPRDVGSAVEDVTRAVQHVEVDIGIFGLLNQLQLASSAEMLMVTMW
jgi:hypothetical protein